MCGNTPPHMKMEGVTWKAVYPGSYFQERHHEHSSLLLMRCVEQDSILFPQIFNLRYQRGYSQRRTHARERSI